MEAQDSATIRFCEEFCGRLSLREEKVDLNIANFLSLELDLMLGEGFFLLIPQNLKILEL